jgi:hypothetical protein
MPFTFLAHQVTALPFKLVAPASAAVGALSHLALDACTHRDGWVVERVGVLRATVLDLGPFAGLPVYQLLQTAGSVVAAAIVFRWMAKIGREHRMADWAPERTLPRPTVRSATALWGWTIGVTGATVLVIAAAGFPGGVHEIIRIAAGGFVGLVIGCRQAARQLRATSAVQQRAVPERTQCFTAP